MTKRVQRVRHDNAGSATFLGKLGEITVNTGNKSAIVHDGINAGGTEQARADLVNVAVATAANAGKMSAQQAAELAQALLDIVTNADAISNNNMVALAGIAANLVLIQSNDADIAQNVTDIETNTTKLAGIEAGADVTDTANVTAAGALMDSEVDLDIKTLILPASTTISPYIRTLTNDLNAAAARATLELEALAILSSVGPAQIDADAVATEYAATALGAIGSVAMLVRISAGLDIIAGTTYAGSLFYYGGVTLNSITDNTVNASSIVAGSTPSGTWRALGHAEPDAGKHAVTLFLRIS